MIARAERFRSKVSEEPLVGPIQGELLGADRLAAQARVVARERRLAAGRLPLRPARLLARLEETRRLLRNAHAQLTEAAAAGVDAGPAAEWFLDNYYVVQDHLQEVRATLPRGYYRELPELASGPLAGYPRVYEIAISLISHAEAQVDLENVDLYVEAFQSVTALTVRELWAMPAMLRLGLIESVRRMTLRTVHRLDDLALATSWADRIVNASSGSGAEMRATLRDFVQGGHALSPDFVSRFLQSLRQAEGASAPLAWLEHWMREVGLSPEQAMAQATQRLALTQIVMANSINSLRDIGRRDWRMFVEKQSAMEAVLREDPSGFYPQMTFATRDRYRHVVEGIAKRTEHSEPVVARWAIDLARHELPAADVAIDRRRSHVGFYLVDDGLAELERVAGYAPPPRVRLERLVRLHPEAVYFGGLSLLVVLVVFTMTLVTGVGAPNVWWLMLPLVFLPALDVAVTIFHQLVSVLMPPRTLSRLDLKEHNPGAEYRTAVVIPTLFADVEDVHAALENLEVQFLANRDARLRYAILSDFTDAPAEHMAGDDEIVAAALEGVRALNERYAPDEFYLLHRPRRWNEREGAWMGWERKRGKLSEFNRLLRGGSAEAFSVMIGDTAKLQDVRYVITLDSDTLLPPDAATSLIGALAHPLNRAVYDVERGRVMHGYGILQPRVGVSLPSAHRSRFAAISSGHPGVDPYTTAVSDVYQDLFAEGSFTGKGIYDVDAFQLAMHGRFPENTLLSHDLIEGNYARAGLATDVIVYDEYPSSYVADAKRKHRWIRGDWQLLPWLRLLVPGPDGPERNRLSILSQWKILDNLRRSLREISQLLLLVAGWTVLPGSPWRWTLISLGVLAAPWVTAMVLALVRPPRDGSWSAYYGEVWQDASLYVQQFAITLATLPHQAAISGDAIVRTLHRLFVSGRRLLEWQTASFVERTVSNLAADTWRSMRASVWMVAVGMVGFAYAAVRKNESNALTPGWPIAFVVLVEAVMLLWLSAPLLFMQLSRVAVSTPRSLSTSERATAKRFATHHWRFFERHVTEATAWLAPDNFQTSPQPEVAMRTSPTNIGLQLMATVSARDLGLITADEMTYRLEQAFATLEIMPRYRGHFYNWYGLPTLRVLEPPYISVVDSGNLAGYLIALYQACLEMSGEEPKVAQRLQALAIQAYQFMSEMDFSFLYDRARKLFTIGYHPESFTPDAAYYDLLASEARLASFIAIAKNDVPVEHWFRLSRALNRTGGATALLSWSGSLFEYLLPALVMRPLPYTLLDQTYRGALDRHMAFGRDRGVPWGVSESAYNFRDHHQTYQYRGFGVPDLALKRGLGRDLVIAPYASALAAMVDAPRALSNLQALEGMGVLAEDGFYDAVDYTRPDGGPFAVVQTHMAHHVGMTLVAFTNVLRDNVWQKRFHADPLVKAVELLLHERVPRRLVLRKSQPAQPEDGRPESDGQVPVIREVNTAKPAGPRVALLGTVPYTVMLNHNGSGYSRYEDLAVTRWRSDRSQDDTGQFCFVKDLASGRVWSTGVQPVGAAAERSRAYLAPDRVTLHRFDRDIETKTEISVVPGDSAEVRRVTLTNASSETREIELTSYSEVVMAPPAADHAHPAFSKLFVETEWHAWCSAITAARRPRDPGDRLLWCVHVVDVGHDRVGDVSCETDRARFLGRGRTLRNPAAMDSDGNLSGTTGAVLDPIVSLRTRVRLGPGQSTSVSFTTLVATTREEAFVLADRYHDSRAAQRAFDVSSTTTDLEMRELGITPAKAALFQDLATQVLYGGGSLAPPPDELQRNRGSQERLWPHGISGDIPIVLARIDSLDGLSTLRELLAAHRYWRRRGLTVDLVVVNAHPHDYLQELRDGIMEAVAAAHDATLVDQRGGIMIRRREVFQPDEYLMLSATARIHIPCDGRSLSRALAVAEALKYRSALERAGLEAGWIDAATPPGATPAADRGGALGSIATALRPLVAPLLPSTWRARDVGEERSPESNELRFFNGIGGIDDDGDYQMIVDDGLLPPAPWINVIANPLGGFIVSERGAGFSWAENAQFYRLTPWHNDPVTDPISDILFVKDRETGDLWSPTPAPIADGQYHVRHSPGSTTFEHEHDGVRSELLLCMADDAAVKVSLLRLRNQSDKKRRLTLTAYVDWTLGTRREDTQYQVRTQFESELSAILARNHFDSTFSNWTAFLATNEEVTSYTADRQAFIGPNGSLADPRALRQKALNGETGVGLDPCGALQIELTLAPGESRDVTVLLGAARNDDEARQMVQRLRTTGHASRAITRSLDSWAERLSVVAVRTPDATFDVMLNRWTLYQALASRMWARTGLYQSSGAYGFRDQLQDVLAFVYAEPGVARRHILRSAARQFIEGDVQHWWHAHSGRGVRTRFSDDLVWLPYVVDRYVRVTGDASVLDEEVPFLSMRALQPDEHEVYDLPRVADERASVYEHCRRALRHGCTAGEHGLPLIGTGDWNDGMNRVGAQGRGESVWLAWFLIATLRSFAEHADARGDHVESTWMRQRADSYAQAAETSAWDGQWYRRAYYDDGTPLGSAESDECRIDSIAQSWSVISGAASAERQQAAMVALDQHLVREDAQLILLLTPPFDHGTHDPGYIMGYLPGVRENGAQYTHAALWAVMATARQGDGDRAFELFQMINPLNRTTNAEGVQRYKVEPYVVAADVYSTPAHLGRGGWTWYTGSASWMYRIGLEEILGFRKVGDALRIEPCVPNGWTAYEIVYRFKSATYEIAVRDPAGARRHGAEVTVDGARNREGIIPLVDDGRRHTVVVAPLTDG